MRAMAADPADRFATARQMREALTRCLDALGASNREHDVTASLAALMETARAGADPARARRGGARGDRDRRRPFFGRPGRRALRGRDHRSLGADPDVGRADGKRLCRPSGGTAAAAGDPQPRARQHRAAPSPPPQSRSADPSAPHWSPPGQLFERVFGGPSGTAPGLLGWRRTPEQPPHDSHRSPLQRAVELFDRGSRCAWRDATARRSKPGNGRPRWPPRTASTESNVAGCASSSTSSAAPSTASPTGAAATWPRFMGTREGSEPCDD